jgi:hypothetical protein
MITIQKEVHRDVLITLYIYGLRKVVKNVKIQIHRI